MLTINSFQWVLLPKNQDMANAQNTYYVGLRNSAIREGDLMVSPLHLAAMFVP